MTMKQNGTLVIIGLGNEYVGDDGAGIYGLRFLKEQMERHGICDGIVFAELAVGGMALLDQIIGFDRCIILDAVVTGMNPPGTLYRTSFSAADPAGPVTTSHQIDLSQILRLSHLIAARAPSEVAVYGIEAAEVRTFGSRQSEAVANALPCLISRILADLVDPPFPQERAGVWEIISPGKHTPLTMEHLCQQPLPVSQA